MKKYITEYIEEMAETLSESTVRGHRSTLNRFLKVVSVSEPVEVTAKSIVDYRNSEYEKKTVGTVNTQLKRIKQFFEWCVKKDIIGISPAEQVRLLTEAEALPKWLNEEQEDLLIRTISKKYLGSQINPEDRSYRELAIVMLMMKAGLRVGEVSNLKLDEVQIHGDRGKILVRGKGQQQRTVNLISDLVRILKQYLKHHTPTGKYLFYSQRSDSISIRMIQTIVSELRTAEYGNVSLKDLTPHVLRHTFAHNLANGGMALEAIARQLGHMKKNGEPNIQQTIRYTKSSDEEIGNEMDRILSLQ